MLRRCQRDFPGFFELEGVGFDGFGGCRLLLLLLLLLGALLKGEGLVSFVDCSNVSVGRRTCLVGRPLVKPGGLGMLADSLEGRGNGVCSAVTQLGGGRGGSEDLASIVCVSQIAGRDWLSGVEDREIQEIDVRGESGRPSRSTRQETDKTICRASTYLLLQYLDSFFLHFLLLLSIYLILLSGFILYILFIRLTTSTVHSFIANEAWGKTNPTNATSPRFRLSPISPFAISH